MTEDGTLKIGDLGESQQMEYKNQMLKTDLVGTGSYMAPEIILKQPYNWKSDIWALGCVLYKLCTFKTPFEGEDIFQQEQLVLYETHKSIPNIYTWRLRDMTDWLLKKESDRRPYIEDIL